jgi:hypothetical protein
MLLEGLLEATNILSQDTRRPGRDSNREVPNTNTEHHHSRNLLDLGFSRRWLWRILCPRIERCVICPKSTEVVTQASNQYCLLPASCWFLVSSALQPCGRRGHVLPKLGMRFNGLQGVIIPEDRSLQRNNIFRIFWQAKYQGKLFVRRCDDKSLVFPISYFPICSTTKIISLGWVKEVRTTKS